MWTREEKNRPQISAIRTTHPAPRCKCAARPISSSGCIPHRQSPIMTASKPLPGPYGGKHTVPRHRKATNQSSGWSEPSQNTHTATHPHPLPLHSSPVPNPRTYATGQRERNKRREREGHPANEKATMHTGRFGPCRAPICRPPLLLRAPPLTHYYATQTNHMVLCPDSCGFCPAYLRLEQ